LSLVHHGAQRASRRSLRFFLVALLAAAFAISGLAVVGPKPALGAGKKVVVIVGPVGSKTAEYISSAKQYASAARAYGASVYEIYSPNATWSKVKSVSQGANILIYLGHGNGWPSPYGSYQPYTKDGFGLNATAGNGNSNTKYWGEYYIARDINLAPNAVVILNRLCYASGNSEPGRANPTKSTAIKRVDNFGAGFLKAGAKAVFAEGHSSVGYVIYGLFKTNKTMLDIFYSSDSRTMSYRFSFKSSRHPGAIAAMDPKAPGSYYRSIIGSPYMKASTWRG
jgi:hypothetical protein